MKRLTVLLLLAGLSLLSVSQNMLERYQKAEKFLPKNISNLTRNVNLNINEVKGTSDFWYKLQTEKGERYYYFDGENIQSEEAFDHSKLAASLSEIITKQVNPDSLSIKQLVFIPGENKIKFSFDSLLLETDLRNYSTSKREKKKPTPKNQSISPNKKWIVEVREFNLFLKNTETGDEIQLTDDGVKKYEYATPLSWYKMVDESKGDKYDPSISVRWTEDSKKFVTMRLDRRKVGKLFLYQSMPDSGFRAKVWSYERALPGEPAIMEEYYIFDVDSLSKVRVDVEPFADFTASIFPTWQNENTELFFARFKRGYQSIEIFRVNAETGEAITLLTDSSKTMIETQTVNCKWTEDESQFFWTSERDGWNHIYRYDRDGNFLNQVTKGNFAVRGIEKIDNENQLIYFVAGSLEENVDPYYRNLYVTNFEGSFLTLLTNDKTDHQIRIPEKGDYFVDSYSRVDRPTDHVVRSMESGEIIYRLASASLDPLFAKGWKFPEPFKVKARDGETDIYGLIFYPTDFDSAKTYPVLDATYSGPQAVRTPKTFSRGYNNYDVSMAELGFIIVTIDGLGTAWRSKAFHDFSYKNLGDIGAEDHIAGLKQLAETRPWMDLNRVGIYGHSAGGYDAAHTLLTHPEFYKVAVSSAGNHDHRIAKAWWPEQYMGMPGKHYDEQSNFNLAGKLEGKLLLIHGDMDNNVNTASSLRMAAELIKHNKDFELLIIPNKNHGLADHPYFIRKRWDYFIKNLAGEKPPEEYEIKTYN
ncbi:S9 family peptidase [Maribellus maritimus]|uniref:S9 family peptidase n=1 Tax=Maribellus maritimus TaxID=2870838 RepID=UPI001EEA30DA|nr:DPP IV N-terminal domain-containing protein [Maribellus maritimus]MCG6187324.1 S9 family peptidase [Maribellus maritimus]